MHPNKTQLQHFEMLKDASFNAFDGELVVNSLVENAHLWRAALMTTDFGFILRDLPDGFWHVDTMYITPVQGREDELKALANQWDADEVSWIGKEKASRLLHTYDTTQLDNTRIVLRVWWD